LLQIKPLVQLGRARQREVLTNASARLRIKVATSIRRERRIVDSHSTDFASTELNWCALQTRKLKLVAFMEI
jgi:hypothetical protein